MLYKPSSILENVGVFELLHSFSVRFDGEPLKPFVEPLMKLSPIVSVEVSDSKLTLKAPVDLKRSVELTLSVEREECPKLNPPLKVRGSAYGVFDETVKMLRKVRGSDNVRVKVRAGEGALIVEPPRRIFRLENGVEPVEVKVYFGDLKQAIELFEAAGFNPTTLQFSESVLALETEYGNLKLRALVAGQPE